MLVNLSDALTNEGWSSTQEVQLEMASFDSKGASFPLLEKKPITFTFTNVGRDRAHILGNVKLKFQASCDRCLTDVPVELELDFDRLVTSPDLDEDEDVDDKSFMEGYQLNVETFVYNEVIGNWPAKILCKEDCKGICPKCGQNLNMGDCGCDTFVPDPRMAVIQDIFNANKEV